jgi:dihydroorotate dehydrogenase electron transfer subunit
LEPDIVLSEVVSNIELASGIFLIKFKAPYLAENACPGSFVMVHPDNGTDPLLRRPFTICGVSGDMVEILFQVKGSGTDIMSKWEPCRIVDILGPLGNGFSIPDDLENAYLVGGGMGIAPLLFLARNLKGKGVDVKIFYGARSDSETIILEDQDIDGCELYYSTDDGSKGDKGFVTESLNNILKSASANGFINASIFCCGPLNMSEIISKTASTFNLPCQVSLEEKMACGVGACLGCVTCAKGDKYKRVCVDGPVFESMEIDWKKLC